MDRSRSAQRKPAHPPPLRLYDACTGRALRAAPGAGLGHMRAPILRASWKRLSQNLSRFVIATKSSPVSELPCLSRQGDGQPARLPGGLSYSVCFCYVPHRLFPIVDPPCASMRIALPQGRFPKLPWPVRTLGTFAPVLALLNVEICGESVARDHEHHEGTSLQRYRARRCHCAPKAPARRPPAQATLANLSRSTIAKSSPFFEGSTVGRKGSQSASWER